MSRYGRVELNKFEKKAVMMVTMDERYHTLDQVAEKLQVSRRTVNRWVAAGSLPVIRLSAHAGSVRVTETDLRKFLEERRTQPPANPED